MKPIMTCSPISLANLLAGIAFVDPIWDRIITGVTDDSRDVQSGYLFVARKGLKTDGRDYLSDALEKGAAAILAEEGSVADEHLKQLIPVFWVPDPQHLLSKLSARFYGNPSRLLPLIGVTGTSGKTTISYLLASAFTLLKQSCGYLGTLGYGVFPDLQPSDYTTPSAIDVQRILADFSNRSLDCVAMEVSSHALEQGRVKQVEFNTAVFTNLSHEHLDYHGNMNAYGEAKLRLFQQFRLEHAILNRDDPFTSTILSKLPKAVTPITWSIEGKSADLMAHHLKFNSDGISATLKTPWGKGQLNSQLLGRFNLSNLLAVLACLLVHGIPFQAALETLQRLKSVPGRMQLLLAEDESGPTVIIDYAHKPDALKQVLQTVRAHCQGKLWCVFGCGGDRDETKRPMMGAIAEKYADYLFLTDDNPRAEDPKAIIDAIAAGIQDQTKYRIEHDRRSAIQQAIKEAKTDDVVLIAGKGHETYQLYGNQKKSFSDETVVKEALLV